MKVLTGILTNKETLASDLKSYGLPAGMYIVIMPNGALKVSIK